jgi:hypothetical protein
MVEAREGSRTVMAERNVAGGRTLSIEEGSDGGFNEFGPLGATAEARSNTNQHEMVPIFFLIWTARVSWWTENRGWTGGDNDGGLNGIEMDQEI